MNSILIEVYELFQDKSKWTQGAYARASNGTEVNASNPAATCWCLSGALELKSKNSLEFWEARNRLGTSSIVKVNDIQGYDAVMALLERAISNE